MPKRIQMSRKHPWRTEHPDAVIVDRRTKWGNPLPGGLKVLTSTQVVDGYRDLVMGRTVTVDALDYEITIRAIDVHTPVPTVDEIRAELAGKNLACWCPLPKPGEPDICHASVLLEIANGDHQ